MQLLHRNFRTKRSVVVALRCFHQMYLDGLIEDKCTDCGKTEYRLTAVPLSNSLPILERRLGMESPQRTPSLVPFCVDCVARYLALFAYAANPARKEEDGVTAGEIDEEKRRIVKSKKISGRKVMVYSYGNTYL